MSLLCAGCDAAIDDDSFYCDQCGVQVMKCSKCGYAGKGKRCPNDGTLLMPARSLAGLGTAAASAATPPTTAPTVAVTGAPLVAPAPAVTTLPMSAGPASPGRSLCLDSPSHGIRLRPAPGDLLGRRDGPHAGVLSRFSQISSKHLELERDAAGQWFGRDMNSFNHSFYNGRQLVSGQAQRLEEGATLSLGDVAFTVAFE